jgi:hypothetical protein
MAKGDRFGFIERRPEDRGWVPSPGTWTAPEGFRAGKDWVPPGGAVERLDRIPRWVRAWSHVPLRAIGNFEGWLWGHGGYYVEGPAAGAERQRRDEIYAAKFELIREAMEDTRPWPAPVDALTRDVEAVDVDVYEEFAVVVAAVRNDRIGPFAS